MSPIDNRAMLLDLMDRGRIAIRPSALFDRAWPAPRPAALRDRLEGMLLGLAIGDALGNTTESMNPADRLASHGEIRDYLPNRHAAGQKIGLPSDDSQMAFWTVARLNADGGLVPERLAAEFCAHRIFGIGGNVREFVRRYRDEGLPWYEAAPRSAGNGALMRIAPVVLPHVLRPGPALIADAAIAATITHDDTASTASCVAFAIMLMELLSMDEPPAPAWWIDTFRDLVRQIELDTEYRPRKPGLAWSGTLSRFLDEFTKPALEQGLDVRVACDGWYSGAYLLETVPSVAYILARHGHDPEEAIIRAVNDTRDNDTIAAIIGAAVGALHGRGGLPERWIAGLAGRTGPEDDGVVFRLIDEAVRLWAGGEA